MNLAAPFSAARRRSAGFTLVEMVITLTVFVLLSAAIFGIISGVLTSASTLQGNQNRQDEVAALQSFLGKKLHDLPGQSLLGSYRRGDGEGLDQNGIIFGTAYFLTAVDAKVQANGLYTLRLASFSSGTDAANGPAVFTKAVQEDDPSLAWTPLLHDVQHMAWRFEAYNAGQWSDQWMNPAIKPNLVEVSVQLAGDQNPTVMDFWIPPIYTATLAAPGNSTPATNAAPVTP
jgi:prepilin-type N-terminal cleavage/methylation domain-containing protein